jgi:hypothetical protein
MPFPADVIVAVALVVVAVVAYVSTARVRQVNRRFRILDEISSVAEAGGSLDETLDALATILVPELGDFCTIDVIESGQVRRAAARVIGPDAKAAEAGLFRRKPALQERMASAAAEARQEPVLFEYVSEEDLRDVAEDEEDLRFLLSLGIRSGVTLELRARGRPTGMLTLGMARSGRRLRPGDVQFASVLAGRVALALDNAGLFSEIERGERERAEIAETLQRGLLPPPLPHIPGWSVAAMYAPAGAENEIGGDFYDAFRIAGGWMVVVGDVTGRGAHAAAVTAHARYTLRTAAALTADPVIALRTLNRELLSRLQCRRDGSRGRPERAGAPGGGGSPAAAADRGPLGAGGDHAGSGPRRLSRGQLEDRADPGRTGSAAGRGHRRRHRGSRPRGPFR